MKVNTKAKIILGIIFFGVFLTGVMCGFLLPKSAEELQIPEGWTICYKSETDKWCPKTDDGILLISFYQSSTYRGAVKKAIEAYKNRKDYESEGEGWIEVNKKEIE